jgi:hypothetical protein
VWGLIEENSTEFLEGGRERGREERRREKPFVMITGQQERQGLDFGMQSRVQEAYHLSLASRNSEVSRRKIRPCKAGKSSTRKDAVKRIKRVISALFQKIIGDGIKEG